MSNHSKQSQTHFLNNYFNFFSSECLGEKTAEVAANKRYLKLKMVVEEGRQEEVEETERQRRSGEAD